MNLNVEMESKLSMKNVMMVICKMGMDVAINVLLRKILFARHHQIFLVAK